VVLSSGAGDESSPPEQAVAKTMIGTSINAVMYLRVIARKYVSKHSGVTIPRTVTFHCDSGVVLFAITE
jgi:hypothetical protein